MSTATEISRLSNARNTIRDKLIDLGLATSTDKLDALASAVDGITNRGAVSATVQEGDTYTIPAGYHNGSGTVSGVAGGGNYSLQTKGPITPTKSQQNIAPDTGYYGLSAVTIGAIPEAYQNVSSVTASANDVLSPKIIVASNGTTITGSMPNNGAVSKTLDATSNNQSYTVPSGYHNGAGTVSIVLETKTATPSTSSQNITPTSGKVLSKVTVAAIPSKFGDTTSDTAVASNLLSGKKAHTISGGAAVQITGTMPNNGAVSKTLDASTNNQSYTIPSGYHNGSGTVNVVLETREVTPSTSTQIIAPLTGNVLSLVTINAIPSQYQDITSVTASAADVLAGASIIDSSGALISGTMPNNGAQTVVLSISGDQSYTIPSGYHNGSGTVSIDAVDLIAQPNTFDVDVTPAEGKVISKVTVLAIPSKYGDTTGDTGVASNVLAGIKVHTINNGAATQITGTMANNGAISGSIDGLTYTSYSIPSGYTSGGTVSLTSDIETALAAI